MSRRQRALRWDLFMHGFWLCFTWVPCRLLKAMGQPEAMRPFEQGLKQHRLLRRFYGAA